MRRTLIYSSLVIAAVSATLSARQMPASPVYAIRGAKIVTAAGAAIDKGNLVMRAGLITDVGAAAAIPEDAIVVDGAGMTVSLGMSLMLPPPRARIVKKR